MMRGVILALAVGATSLSLTSFDGHAQTVHKPNAALPLDRGWQFRQISADTPSSDLGWMPASVPGEVHLDLLANKRIEDPFYRDSESKLQWIENASWEYRDTFEVSTDLMSRSSVDLVLEG